MPEPVSIITLCVIGVMCLISLCRTVKEEWQESHAKRFSAYTRRTFSSLGQDVKLYCYLFLLLKEHAGSKKIQTQSSVRNQISTEPAEVLVIGDMVRFVWTAARGDPGMWLYIQPQGLDITMFCYNVETRNTFMRRLEACCQDVEGKSHQRFELTGIWIP